MKLTKEQALTLHRQMWGDMQRDLGDQPIGSDRVKYKQKWCHEHFPTEFIDSHCFLCEYAYVDGKFSCMRCPIKWPNEPKTNYICYCVIDDYYYKAPISEILALPEREVRE